MKNNTIEYQMSKQMFDSLLSTRSEIEKKENPYQYVMKIINEEFGLKGQVKHLHLV